MKRKTDNFSKFYTKKNNAAIKESFRQEKKAAKKERKEAIERRFEEKRKARFGEQPPERSAPGKYAARSQSPHQTQRPAPKGPQAKGAPGKYVATTGAAKAAPGKYAAPTGPVKPGAPIKPGAKPLPANTLSPTAPANSAFKGGAPASAAHGGEQLPLNKYIAHSGVCSRRDAADLIKQGKVTVNGQPVTEPGTKVNPSDVVVVNGKKVTISRNFVYILLNKPKDYITTTDDPQGRKTVLDLIRKATTERVFPVGRLDRNTSGVLLLTNDGDLAQKLAHPSHEIKKIYHVMLDKPLTKADFDKIISGQITLEDGPAHVDVLAYADPKDKTQIGLEIHSGRNRIVRRIFEHLGYDVRGLDRVMYAGLTKKNVQRGTFRLLNEKEIRILKYLNSSFKGSLAPSKAAGAHKAANAQNAAHAQNAAYAQNAPDGANQRPEKAKYAAESRPEKAPKSRRPYNATKAPEGRPAKATHTPGKRPARTEAPSKRPTRAEASGAPGKHPAKSIPPKGRKPAGPPKGRKPYNAKAPRPEKD